VEVPLPVPPAPDATRLLLAWRSGNRAALEDLAPLVYAELHKLAHRYILGERHAPAVPTRAVVDDAFARLVEPERVRSQNRVHFYVISAPLMRRIMVDAARRRRALQGGQVAHLGVDVHLDLDEPAVISREPDADIIALDEAMKTLADIDPQKNQVVELRYFGGLSVEETAEALDVSPETVARDSKMAKQFLLREVRRVLSIEPTA
jgi:RNA polymerase sigma factor (TIGR02999 family)